MTDHPTTRFTRVSVETVLRADADGAPVFRRCHAHELLLSFFDDVGAEAFSDWWDAEGAEVFGQWFSENSDDY